MTYSHNSLDHFSEENEITLPIIASSNSGKRLKNVEAANRLWNEFYGDVPTVKNAPYSDKTVSFSKRVKVIYYHSEMSIYEERRRRRRRRSLGRRILRSICKFFLLGVNDQSYLD